jgi:hypothetical protein
VERTSPDIRLIHNIQKKPLELDKNLPVWARRSNPIVRRHLGMYWKTILPEMGFLVKVVLIQAGLILLSLPMPFLFNLALPTITASILLLPFAVYIYLKVLYSIGSAACTSVADELRNDTMDVLLATPLELNSILGSKIAAAIWRQVDNLGLLIISAALFSLPILISQYASLWPLEEYPVLSRVAMIVGLTVSLVRLALEPFMIGAIGVMAGAALRVRSSAIITMAIFGFFYFVMLNILRLIPMWWPLRFAVEFILPIVLPILISWVSLAIARALLRD